MAKDSASAAPMSREDRLKARARREQVWAQRMAKHQAKKAKVGARVSQKDQRKQAAANRVAFQAEWKAERDLRAAKRAKRKEKLAVKA